MVMKIYDRFVTARGFAPLEAKRSSTLCKYQTSAYASAELIKLTFLLNRSSKRRQDKERSKCHLPSCIEQGQVITFGEYTRVSLVCIIVQRSLSNRLKYRRLNSQLAQTCRQA